MDSNAQNLGLGLRLDLDARDRSTGNGLLFMYGGQGFQYFGMGKELFQCNSTFRAAFEHYDALLYPMIGASIIEVVYELNEDSKAFDNILYSHPALYVFGLALTKALAAKGVTPNAVLGYSLGEYIAATVSGALSEEEGLRLVVGQAKLFANSGQQGGMLTVAKDISDYQQWPEVYANVALACVNYPRNFVVSGTQTDIKALTTTLKSRQVLTVDLPVRYGFHSRAIDELGDTFRAQTATLGNRKPTNTLLYSCLKNAWIDSLPGNYWWDVVRSQVDFLSAGRQLANSGYTCVDLSATGSLAAFLTTGIGIATPCHATVNRFNRNLKSLDRLLVALET